MKRTRKINTCTLIAGILAMLLILTAGCKNAGQQQAADAPATDAETSEAEKIEDLSGYEVPDAYEITRLIYEAGAPYVMKLSNGPEKADDYITPRGKALALGVYGTDLCYAGMYMMRSATLEYLEATKTLIDELGISTVLSVSYADRIENSLDERDSLIQVVVETFDDSWDHLVENEQDMQARLVVCGSWIEGIYITSNIAKTAMDNTVFLEILARQKNSLSHLVSLIEPVRDMEEIGDIYMALTGLEAIYRNVDESLTNDQLDELLGKISALRNSIV